MKVAVVGPAPPWPGGIAAHTAGLASALVEAGHRVEILSFRRLYPPGVRKAPAREGQGAAIIDTLDPRTWRAAAKWLERGKFERVVVEWWHPVLGGAVELALRAVEPERVVMVVHNVVPHERLPASKVLLRRTAARAGRLLAHSRFVARQVSVATGGRRAEVVEMPVLFPVERAAAMAASKARRRLGLGPARTTVGALGLIRPYKGIDVLVDAWRKVPRRSGARLLIAGEACSRWALARALAGRRPRGLDVIPRYLGEDELVAAVAACDAVVFAHRRASQSGMLPAVRALGIPVVVSAAGGLPDQLRGEGWFRLVRPERPRELAAAIESALAVGGWRAAASTEELWERARQARQRSWGELVRACLRVEGGCRASRQTESGFENA